MASIQLSVRDQLIELLDRMTDKQMEVLLAVADSLRAEHKSRPAGESGKAFVARMKRIDADPADLEEMRLIIEEEFEQVEADDLNAPIFPA